MESSEEVTKITILTLDEAEKQWLHGQMQNPLHCQLPQDEDDYDAAMRAAFFAATS